MLLARNTMDSISGPSRQSDARHSRHRAVEIFRDVILRRGRGADAILDAAKAAPDSPAVLACAAAYHLLCDTRSGIEQAIPLLDQAATLVLPGRPGDAALVAALAAIARDDVKSADSAFLSLASTTPDDLFAGYIGHLHFLNHGRQDAMLKQAQLLTRANPGDPFALGMLAFALHEIGAIDAAWDAAIEAESADPSIAWVHHAAAHIFLSRRQSEVGLTWLERRAPYWRDCGSSMFTHNWWHGQLLMLDGGDIAAALSLYDRLIAPEANQSISSFVNAASLLARIALRGGDVGSRWLPLAEEARAHSGEHVLPFIDLHYAVALAGSGDVAGCAAIRLSAWRHATHTAGSLRAAWKLAGLPLLDAIGAYARGDRYRAGQALDQALPHLRRVGGSNQQRALFYEFAGWARNVVSSRNRRTVTATASVL
jgi:hypothetical protein